MTVMVTLHEQGLTRTETVDFPGPVEAAEALLKVGVSNLSGRGLSVQGRSITPTTRLEQPGTELEVHPHPVFG